MTKLKILLVLILSVNIALAQKQSNFVPCIKWKDTQGNFINAHGGGILYYNGTYYWYGEFKKGKTNLISYDKTWDNYHINPSGISCYSSKDLLNWKFEGVALPANANDSTNDLYIAGVIERPKVVYNKTTHKFVMWMHVDNELYSHAKAGLAVSDKPTGPFKYLGSQRPNGAMSRDMTLFQDDDGKVYHFFSSEDNQTMHVCLLSDDYLSFTKKETRILIHQYREAPSVFKYNGKYYIITSGCSGWEPNMASYAVADSILGEWKTGDNPCLGPHSDSTFYAQGTYVLPVIGKKDAFIFMADKWNKNNLEDSRYIWLPLKMENGKPVIVWQDKWNLSWFKN